jgi:ABC-type branched-subunit amino acid transport system ATPase component
VTTPPLLEVQALSKEFGGLAAVRKLDFVVRDGQIKALIGPNGAGKTTTFNLIAGALAPTGGRIMFQGEPLPVRRPHAVAARGIARTFQLVRLFHEMTTLENVLVGCHRLGAAGWAASAFRSSAMRAEECRLRERACQVLALLGLEERAGVPAALLTYGEQRLIEMGRALAMEPRLLLLDEPGAGLNRDERLRLTGLIRRVREAGTTIILVDHHVEFVMGVSDEVLVLSYGEKLAEGPPRVVRSHPAVIAAYLGDEEA